MAGITYRIGICNTHCDEVHLEKCSNLKVTKKRIKYNVINDQRLVRKVKYYIKVYVLKPHNSLSNSVSGNNVIVVDDRHLATVDVAPSIGTKIDTGSYM